ncbi:hypothetical protein GCM10011369_06460 [Neiella marina]|uniref:Lipoyl-binding domain-containing protein n=1 Tax=Neiella marina TaxID=508461 RepID=A0A8J2XMX5_9GAMM|nr:biotin/lipoyl-containing protein [Neiella marina]GGA67531.1 hypothetical protein GCM10011369_06460 [Neiella marina]
MGQLFPTIYFSFDGFQRRQLKQDLLRAFNQSRLSELGFKVQFSPRTVVDFGVPDGLTVTQQCQQASLFVALLEQQPGHGSRQHMLNTELSYAIPEAGTHVVLLSEQQPELPAQMGRQLEQNDLSVQILGQGELTEAIFAQLETALLGIETPLTLSILAQDYGIDGTNLDKDSWQQHQHHELLAQLYGQAPEPANGSPALADLQQHRHWGVASLQLGNAVGAGQSFQHCLALNDSDLMANYWRCRLLAEDATKEAEFNELIRRGQLLLKHFQQQDEGAEELQAQCHYFQALGHVGQKRYEEALESMQAALLFRQSIAWQHQAALRALQLLSQQEVAPERLDPTLLTAKNCFLAMLTESLEGFQLSFRQLLLKTSKEKLEMVILGVKQVVLAALKQIRQHHQQLLDQCAECELIVTTQLDDTAPHDIMAKSIWNLIAIGQDSISQQVTLMQLLAGQLNRLDDDAQQLELQASEQALQQQRISQDINKQQHRFKDTLSGKKLSITGSSVAAALCVVLISGFWWLPLTTVTISILLAAALAAFLLLIYLLSRQQSMLAHIQQRCRELDSQYALSDDDLPEPRTIEGWFDRLTVRRDKHQERERLLQDKAAALRAMLQPRISQFMRLQTSFAEQAFEQLGGAFIGKRFAGKQSKFRRQQTVKPQLTEALVAQLANDIEQPPTQLVLKQSQNPEDIYFSPSEACQLRGLNLLQDAANADLPLTLVHAPVVTTDEPLALSKWLVQTGEQVTAEQPIAELQNATCSIPLFAPANGLVIKQLVAEGHDLTPEQAVLELQID